MSTLKVGEVEMKVVRTNHIGRRSFRSADNAEHLYTDWIIDAECWWNPSATSYTGSVAQINEAPFGGGGVLPAVTDSAIRDYLMQSRREINYRDSIGNIILLCRNRNYPSGDPNVLYDVANGPWVEHCNVNRIHGEKSWHISIRIRACVNSCPGYLGQGVFANPLISNRWSQYEEMDEDYFKTIVTQGVAVFRGDELIRRGTYPDQYRKDLLFSIPNNFKRDPVYVEAASDGNTLMYRIVDREKPLNINQAYHDLGVTRIEAYQTGGYQRESYYGPVAQMAMGTAQIAVSVAGWASPGAGAGAVYGIQNIFRAVERMVPQYKNGVIVSIWGNRYATRAALTGLALQIALARVGDNTFRRGINFVVTHDLMGKYTRLEVSHNWGIDQVITDLINIAGNAHAWQQMAQVPAAVLAGGAAGGAAAIANVFAGAPNAAAQQLAQQFGESVGLGAIFTTLQFPGPWDNTSLLTGSGDPNHFEVDAQGNQTLSNDSLPALSTTHPPPPNSSGTRGTSLITIVSQLLNDPCGVPDPPPALVQYSDQAVYE